MADKVRFTTGLDKVDFEGLGRAVYATYRVMGHLEMGDQEALERSVTHYLQDGSIELPLRHCDGTVSPDSLTAVPTTLFEQFLITAGEDADDVEEALGIQWGEWAQLVEEIGGGES